MLSFNEVVITMNKNGHTSIVVDGQKIEGVASVSFADAVDDVPTLSITQKYYGKKPIQDKSQGESIGGVTYHVPSRVNTTDVSHLDSSAREWR